MKFFMSFLDIVGTISFALSGAMTGIRKKMDLMGICLLGCITATGGGIMRDLILDVTPPVAFTNPKYVIISIIVSLLMFVPFIRHILTKNHFIHEAVFFIADSAGLGVFVVFGVEMAINYGYMGNKFLVLFIGLLTGVGGGVLRDVLAGDRPYIFVKHIYALAAIIGAIICIALWGVVGKNFAMIISANVIFLIRLFSAKYHLNLPKIDEELV